MKIVIISDIHDNLANLEKAVNWLNKNKIDRLICCGDVVNTDTLKELDNIGKPIYLIRGNMEIYYEEELSQFKNINYLGRFGMVELDGIRVGVCHEPLFFPELEKEKCNIIFYGHTHKPWIETKGKVQYVNPGTLGGVFQRGTFSVWDTLEKTLELKILDNI